MKHMKLLLIKSVALGVVAASGAYALDGPSGPMTPRALVEVRGRHRSTVSSRVVPAS